MDFNRHLAVGQLALSRGVLSSRTFGQIMIEVGMLSDQGIGEEVWLEPGRLTAEQFEDICAQLDQKPLPPTEVAPLSDPFPSAAPPVVVEAPVGAGRYERLGMLGSGGMGDVEERLDRVLERKIAFKVARLNSGDRKMLRAMFEREAKVTGILEHPSIIPVYDMGVDELGRPFYTMRIVREASLAAVIDKIAQQDPETLVEYTLHRLLRAFVQICHAVDYAHNHGFVHRDLKAPNILLGSYGEVLVVDWGLACPAGKPPEIFGGTPGYLPPEQFNMQLPADPRSDVFSLGAILYEIICQKLPFPHQSGQEAAVAAVDPAKGYAYRSLLERDAPWEISETLNEICARALHHDIEKRFPSARALAQAVDEFLEGTKEKERRQRKADELVETGDLLRANYEDVISERPTRVEEFLALQNEVAPWEPEEKKEALWNAEDQFAVMEALAVRTMQEVITAYEQAIEEVPNHPGARAGLARLYAAELRRAEDRRDGFNRTHFEERLRRVTSDRPRPKATLDIDTGEMEADVQLLQFIEERRRLSPTEVRKLGRTPLRGVEIEPGSYLLRLRRSSFAPVDYPVLLRSGDELQLTVDLLASTELADDEILVPGGNALLGGDEGGRLLREVNVPSFVISREPVTFAQYLQFVADISRTHQSLVENYLPLSDEGSPYWLWTGGKFRPGKVLRWGDDPMRLLRLPAIGIDAWAAEAYATWRTKRTGRIYRLPTEDEWEKAARGVDGRRYPWGDSFDASFCKMSESRPVIPAPEPSGTFSTDISVYGVRDMAGGIADWVIPTHEDDSRDENKIRRLVSRGGAFCDSQLDCRLTSRRHYLAIERSQRLGFRLARTPSGRALNSQISPVVANSSPRVSILPRNE